MICKLARLLLIGSLCAGVSFAQSRNGRNGTGGAVGEAGVMNEEGTVNVLAALLNLNDSQQQQLRAILDDALQMAKPIQDQLNGARQSVFLAARAARSDDEIGKLANQQGVFYAQITSLQARTFSKICKLLTRDQRAQVDSSLYDMLETFVSSESSGAGLAEKSVPETQPK
ncbi:MAG: Spy/CpxP family protein refolding chaperone [Candidatus Acidiferrales bacterium]